MVLFNTAHKTRELLNTYYHAQQQQQQGQGRGEGTVGGFGGLPPDVPMQEYALGWALQQPGIAHIVLGMTNEAQVEQALSVLESRR